MSSCSNVTGSRIFSVFVFLCLLFLSKDYWLPSSHSVPWTTGSGTHDVSDADHAVSESKADQILKLAERPQATVTTATTVTVTESAITTATPTPFHDDGCSSAPDAHRIMVIMKTGATELEYKLPTHLITLLKCIPHGHFIIFSDMAQTFADYPVFDAVQNAVSYTHLTLPTIYSV